MGNTFRERLRELRLKNKMTQADFAKILNISMQSYSAYENGREPSYGILIKIAKHFDATTDYLLGVTEEPCTMIIPELEDRRNALMHDINRLKKAMDGINKILKTY